MDFEIDYYQNNVVIKAQLYPAASWSQRVLAVRGEDGAMNHFAFVCYQTRMKRQIYLYLYCMYIFWDAALIGSEPRNHNSLMKSVIQSLTWGHCWEMSITVWDIVNIIIQYFHLTLSAICHVFQIFLLSVTIINLLLINTVMLLLLNTSNSVLRIQSYT